MNTLKEKIFSRIKNTHRIYFVLCIIAFLFVLPIYTFKGLWASFDTPTHVSMIAQFHYALQHFYFPVVWTQGVANYGLPFGIVAHPMTNYLGGILTLITNNPITSYKLVWGIFSLISVIGMYQLLRRFFGVLPAVAGVFLYAFSAYRILNLYVRGALPEFAAAAFLPFLLNALFDSTINKSKLSIFIQITCWYSLILFTHPMFMIFSGLITFVFMLYYHTKNYLLWLIVGSAVALGIGVNAFFLIPLKTEIKYFYIGQTSNLLVKESGLTWQQLFVEKWEYTCANGDTVELRCNRIQTGLIELSIFIIGAIMLYIRKKNEHRSLLVFGLILGSIPLFLTLRNTEFIYEKISSLGSIQFPYRFLNVWLLIPPLFVGLLLDSIKKYQKFAVILVILIVTLIRLPQIYTKNEYNPPLSSFYYTIDNIHSIMMNTIWMDESKNYPVKKNKIEILQGKGWIEHVSINPVKHSATINASEALLLANYSFFFPGWHAYIDGVEVPIQFQDPAYRGFMTIQIPEGNHRVLFTFEDTAIRFISKGVSLISIALLIFVIYVYKKQPKYIMKFMKFDRLK